MNGFVGADCAKITPRAQIKHRPFSPRIKPRLHRERALILRQQNGIERSNLRLVHRLARPRHASAQHGPPALQRQRGIRAILRIQERAHAQRSKGGIRRRQQIARRIGQCTIQIKHHCFHL